MTGATGRGGGHCLRANMWHRGRQKSLKQNQHLELRKFTQTELDVRKGMKIVGLISQEYATLSRPIAKSLGTI